VQQQDVPGRSVAVPIAVGRPARAWKARKPTRVRSTTRQWCPSKRIL
jgi:hypothetical protein